MIGSVLVALIGSAFAAPTCNWSSYTNPITADANLKPVVAVYGENNKYVAVALGKNVYQLTSDKSGAAPTPTTGVAAKIDGMTFGKDAAYFMEKEKKNYFKSLITKETGAMEANTAVPTSGGKKVVAIAGKDPFTIQHTEGTPKVYSLVNGGTAKTITGAAELGSIAVAGDVAYVTGKKATVPAAGTDPKYNVWKVTSADQGTPSKNKFAHYGGLAVKGDNIYVVGTAVGLLKLSKLGENGETATPLNQAPMDIIFNHVYAVDKKVLAHGGVGTENHKVMISFDDGNKFEALPPNDDITAALKKTNTGVTLGKDGKVYVVYPTETATNYKVMVGVCKAPGPNPPPVTSPTSPTSPTIPTTKKGSAASTKSTLGFVALLAPVLIFAYV